MRIVVSGTHASGKSTLVSDFALRHPQYTVLPDPFDLVDEDAPLGAALFARQLRIAADRLTDDPDVADLVAERGPLDFLAYLLALADLTGEELDDALHERARARVIEARRDARLRARRGRRPWRPSARGSARGAPRWCVGCGPRVADRCRAAISA